jgi:hypothetical protein
VALAEWEAPSKQKDVLFGVGAAGNGFTVTTTLFDFEHPVAVMLSVTV